MERKVEGMANIPEHGKFAILLECGHYMVSDHSVESPSDYMPNKTLICYDCLG